MSYRTMIQALYSNFIGGKGGSVSAHSYDTFPDDDDISVVAHATANTQGDWTEIVSSIGSVDAWFTGLYMSVPNAGTDYKVGFGTGASGSETQKAVFPLTQEVLVTSLQAGKIDSYFTVPFPIHIPNGTRESARAKTGSSAADTIIVVETHAITLA